MPDTSKHIWPITVTTDRYGGSHVENKQVGLS